MAAYTVQTIVDTAITPTLTAVALSDTAVDDGTSRMFFEVANGAGAPITVTIPSQQASIVVPGVGSLAVADISVTVTNGQRRLIGPFTRAYINAAGNVTINYSSITTITAGAFRLARED
jgi:hypothetical protein